MIAKGVDHVSFAVRDLAASRRFYGEILGLEEIPRPRMGIDGAWYRAPDDTQVHLIVPPGDADVGRPPGSIQPLACHTAFGIADYEKALAHLRAHGVEVLQTNAEVGQMWVRDPTGHVIELIARRRG